MTSINSSEGANPFEAVPKRDIPSELLEAHEVLLFDVAALESLLDRWSVRQPSVERCERLVQSVGAFREHLLAHFAGEERDGFMMCVLARAPDRRGAIETLRAEHASLDSEIGALHRMAVEAAKGMDVDPSVLRARLRAFLALLHRHEEKENLLVQEVFYGGSAASAM